jgi:hypothetical protein
MASRQTSGALHRRDCREPRSSRHVRKLSRLGVGLLSPLDAAGAADLRLCDGCVLAPQAGAATYDSVAFRFIAANRHPDHDTIAAFRKRFLKEIEALFVRVLVLAREMGVLKMGTVALEGTKMHANASRHSALSYEYATKLEAQLK